MFHRKTHKKGQKSQSGSIQNISNPVNVSIKGTSNYNVDHGILSPTLSDKNFKLQSSFRDPNQSFSSQVDSSLTSVGFNRKGNPNMFDNEIQSLPPRGSSRMNPPPFRANSKKNQVPPNGDNSRMKSPPPNGDNFRMNTPPPNGPSNRGPLNGLPNRPSNGGNNRMSIPSEEDNYRMNPSPLNRDNYKMNSPPYEDHFRKGSLSSNRENYRMNSPPPNEGPFRNNSIPSNRENFRMNSPHPNEGPFRNNSIPSNRENFRMNSPHSNEGPFRNNSVPSNRENFRMNTPPPNEGPFRNNSVPSNRENFRMNSPHPNEGPFRNNSIPSNRENLRMNSPPPNEGYFRKNSIPLNRDNYRRNSPPPNEDRYRKNSLPSNEDRYRMNSPPPTEDRYRKNSLPPNEDRYRINSPPPNEGKYRMNPPPPNEGKYRMNSSPPNEGKYRMNSPPPYGNGFGLISPLNGNSYNYSSVFRSSSVGSDAGNNKKTGSPQPFPRNQSRSSSRTSHSIERPARSSSVKNSEDVLKTTPNNHSLKNQDFIYKSTPNNSQNNDVQRGRPLSREFIPQDQDFQDIGRSQSETVIGGGFRRTPRERPVPPRVNNGNGGNVGNNSFLYERLGQSRYNEIKTRTAAGEYSTLSDLNFVNGERYNRIYGHGRNESNSSNTGSHNGSHTGSSISNSVSNTLSSFTPIPDPIRRPRSENKTRKPPSIMRRGRSEPRRSSRYGFESDTNSLDFLSDYFDEDMQMKRSSKATDSSYSINEMRDSKRRSSSKTKINTQIVEASPLTNYSKNTLIKDPTFGKDFGINIKTNGKSGLENTSNLETSSSVGRSSFSSQHIVKSASNATTTTTTTTNNNNNDDNTVILLVRVKIILHLHLIWMTFSEILKMKLMLRLVLLLIPQLLIRLVD